MEGGLTWKDGVSIIFVRLPLTMDKHALACEALKDARRLLANSQVTDRAGCGHDGKESDGCCTQGRRQASKKVAYQTTKYTLSPREHHSDLCSC